MSTTGGSQPSRCAPRWSIERTACAARSAPSRSALLIANTSPISISPALSACTASPDSGTSTTSVVSAVSATSSSLCPTPTVSIRMRSKPTASSTSHTSLVAAASPPSEPREAIERMKTPGSPDELPHPHAVAEHRAARERAGRVDRDDRDLCARVAVGAREPGGQRRLAGARGPGDADPEPLARARKRRREQRFGGAGLILHQRDGARQRDAVAGERALEQVRPRGGGRDDGDLRNGVGQANCWIGNE